MTESVEYNSNINMPNTGSGIGIRLKSEIKKNGMTVTELARRSDVLASFIYDIISGKSNNPSTIKLVRIANILDISLTYLISGIDNDSIRDGVKSGKNNYAEIKFTNNIKNTTEYEKSLKIPYLINKNWADEKLGVYTENIRASIINDDGMLPTLTKNDFILINTDDKKPTPPGIFVISDGIGMIAKRLEYIGQPNNEHIRIISDNSNYLTYECHIKDISVIGRVIHLSRII
ncbi:MAG: helix-turn-helix domain-containing protein [Rickettsiales bacterium]